MVYDRLRLAGEEAAAGFKKTPAYHRDELVTTVSKYQTTCGLSDHQSHNRQTRTNDEAKNSNYFSD